MLRPLSVRSRLTLSLVALTTAALGVMAFQFLSTTRLLNELSVEEASKIAAAETYSALAAAYRDQETGIRGYLLTRNREFLEPYDAGRTAEPGLLVDLLVAARDDPAVRTAVDGVRAAAVEWQNRYAVPSLLATEQGRPQTDLDTLRTGKTLFDALRVQLDTLQDAIGSPNERIAAEVADIIRFRLMVLFLLGAGLIAAIVINARYIDRWVARPLHALVATARRVEAGEDVAFIAVRADEIGQLGAALERMRRRLLTEQALSRTNAEQSDVVNRFTELSSFLQSDSNVAAAALEALSELVAPDRGVVHVANRSRDRALVEATRGDGVHAELLTLNALEECPAARRGALYVSPDLSAPLAVRCPVQPSDHGTLACVPLTALGESVGVVHLGWDAPNALRHEHRPAVARIADHSALSIANRRLLHALQGMATTDARTGLANTRAFDEALADALVSARREGLEVPVSVLLLDMDHFKRFNDRYGHPAGDEALRVFARILSGSLRQGDLAARYGGEEFAVLLPGLSTEGARAVAERIRTRTESTIIALGPGQSGRVTVSIGVGTAPRDGYDGPNLLRMVDTALYRAKTAGRNRVVATGDPFGAGEAESGPEEFVATA